MSEQAQYLAQLQAENVAYVANQMHQHSPSTVGGVTNGDYADAQQALIAKMQADPNVAAAEAAKFEAFEKTAQSLAQNDANKLAQAMDALIRADVHNLPQQRAQAYVASMVEHTR